LVVNIKVGMSSIFRIWPTRKSPTCCYSVTTVCVQVDWLFKQVWVWIPAVW